MMRGIEWAALPTVIDLLGITEVDLFIAELVAIREWQNENPMED